MSKKKEMTDVVHDEHDEHDEESCPDCGSHMVEEEGDDRSGDVVGIVNVLGKRAMENLSILLGINPDSQPRAKEVIESNLRTLEMTTNIANSILTEISKSFLGDEESN